MEIFPYDRSALLALTNPDYVADLERFVGGAYDSDTIHGDVTTEALTLPDVVEAKLVAKSDGVFCGALEIEWLMRRAAPSVEWNFSLKEGARFLADNILATFKGNPIELLRVERTLLNVIQRLSGIATLTSEFVHRVAPVRIAATRKTLYGLLDKRAVAMGGGLTHRLSLGDAPMFKDTHFDGVGRRWETVLHALESFPRTFPFVTIEVRKIDRLDELMAELPTNAPWPIFLLLDNFSPADLSVAIHSVVKPPHVYFEASGGITLETAEAYAKTGVDVLSVGALTHTVHPCDFSMQWS